MPKTLIIKKKKKEKYKNVDKYLDLYWFRYPLKYCFPIGSRNSFEKNFIEAVLKSHKCKLLHREIL